MTISSDITSFFSLSRMIICHFCQELAMFCPAILLRAAETGSELLLGQKHAKSTPYAINLVDLTLSKDLELPIEHILLFLFAYIFKVFFIKLVETWQSFLVKIITSPPEILKQSKFHFMRSLVV